MVFKITGIVNSAAEMNGGLLRIIFVGGVRGGKNSNETNDLIIPSSPIAKEHVMKVSISLVGKTSPNKYTVFWNNYHLNITGKTLLDAVPSVISKRKGGGKETVDEMMTRALDALRGKDMFISINPKGTPLTDKTMKGTYIEVVFH